MVVPSRLIVTLTGRLTRRVFSSLRVESMTGDNVVVLLKCVFAAEELRGTKHVPLTLASFSPSFLENSLV